MKLHNLLRISNDWAVNRIHTLCDNHHYENAYAIQNEFREWLDPEIEEHDVYSLEYIGD